MKKKVGILGAGQLALMLAEAGKKIGVECRFLDPDPDSPAKAVGELFVGDYSQESIKKFVQRLELVTCEFENVPFEAAEFCRSLVPFYPNPEAFKIGQHRLLEKTFFQKLGITTPKFHAVDSLDDLKKGIDLIGLPAVLKTCRMGYDGKGQVVIRSRADIRRAYTIVDTGKRQERQEGILEEFIEFDRELSIIAVRSQKKEILFYPLNENVHKEGILRTTIAPATASAGIEKMAQSWARSILESFDYVGVLALEMFEKDGKLFANEMAPRVHNSGHWTIEGSKTSQFENHLRAMCGMELGSTDALGHSAMINIIGTEPDRSKIEAIEGAHLHMYGKEPRPGRKLGHVTIVAPNKALLDSAMQQL